jgi:RNA polymerase sigma-70 factor, ECF subfamily
MPFLRSRPELLAAFRTGERDALEQVYWAYVERVEAFLRRGVAGMRPQPSEIADLLQDVFIRAFGERGRKSYDGLRDYAPYVVTIARNALVDRARQSGREVPVDETIDELAAPTSDPEQPWAAPATLQLVDAYLARLPPALLQVHQQRFVRGLSQREASATLGISRQQLRTRETQLRAGLEEALRSAAILD